MTFKPHELATILAALRIYQQSLAMNGGKPPQDGHDIATDSGSCNPMDPDEIDELEEAINRGHPWDGPDQNRLPTPLEANAAGDMSRESMTERASKEIERPIKISAIIAPHPKFYVAHTGGNCMALRHDRDDGSWVLLTSPGGTSAPSDTDAIIECGFYAAEWDDEGTCVELPVDQVEAWIVAVLSRPMLSDKERTKLHVEAILESRLLPATTGPQEVIAKSEYLSPEDSQFLEDLIRRQESDDRESNATPSG